MFRLAATLIFLVFLVAKPAIVLAGDFVEDSPGGNSSEGSDSTFDPFSDYSEFEEGSEEEADVNFFHNGRFFSVGLIAGYESFTDVLGVIYKPSFTYGVFISYFFDLRFALQVSYMTSDHQLDIETGTAPPFTGKASLTHFGFDVKYYLNTQNVTRGLAALNPYTLIGFSNYTRTTTIDGTALYVRDSAFGMQAGGGLEIPIMHNKGFFGIQATYHYIGFADRNSPIVINGVPQNIKPSGDALDFAGLLGLNF